MEKFISQDGLFPNLIKLECYYPIGYPIGITMSSLVDYTENAAKELARLFPGDNIAFIVRGTSGVMVGGLIASHLIHNVGVCAKVIINRKPSEDCHAENLESIEEVLNYSENFSFRIVIADDFISTGKTLYNIVNAVESYMGSSFVFDALVVQNRFICDEGMGDKGKSGDLRLSEENALVEGLLQTKFLNILCL